MSPTASTIEKIHPSTYLAVLTIASFFRVTGGGLYRDMRQKAVWMIAATLIFLVVYSMTSNGEGGGENSVLVVTFMSAGLFALVLSEADEKTQGEIFWFVSLFLFFNSTVGIVEGMSGFRLLPYVVSSEIIDWDNRPTALLGHPLSNSFITGAWVLALLMQASRDSFRFRSAVVVVFHLLAMVIFGGRASLVLTISIAAIYLVLRALVALVYRRNGRDVIVAVVMIYAAALSVPLLLSSGAADMIIDRFVDSRGSDETRYAAFQMLSSLTAGEWWLGIPISTRQAFLVAGGSTHGIEISWISLVLQFGAPIALSLLICAYLLLRSSMPKGMERFMLLAYFFAASFTSLSIGGKSLFISQTLVILTCISASMARKEASRRSEALLATRIGFPAAA
jgi:hypothetical protein